LIDRDDGHDVRIIEQFSGQPVIIKSTLRECRLDIRVHDDL